MQVYVNQQPATPVHQLQKPPTLYSPGITLLGGHPAGLLNLDVPDCPANGAGNLDTDVRVVDPLGLGKLEIMGKLDSSRGGCFRPVAIKDNLEGGTVEPALLIGIRLGPGMVG